LPTVSRERVIQAGRDSLWATVANPDHLPRWWPGVQRVEDASPAAWTKVLSSPRGRSVRADFTRVQAEAPRRLVWRQEVAESPFERILREAVTEIVLEPAGDQATRVELTERQRLRGLSRLGSPMVRRAARRRLDQALEGLDRVAVGA
jgi:uncharacterized protein YndB with AHSA1/START domain